MILENVKRLCSENHVSIAALEKATCLANGTIRNWDNSSPRASSIKAVADFFGVTVDDLLREDD